MHYRIIHVICRCLHGFCFLIIFYNVPAHAEVVIQSKIGTGNWQSSSAIYPLKGRSIKLNVRAVPDADIRWYRIQPDLYRLYKNANFPWDRNPYKWNGFAKISYSRRELREYRNHWTIEPVFNTEPFSNSKEINAPGSYWLQVVITRNGVTYASPGLEKNDHRGISPEVFRISIRESEGYLGYLTSFFNVPGLFGSVVYQSYNYIGVDCADVLVAAWARWHKQSIKHNYNVAMLVKRLPRLKQFEMNGGTPSIPVKWHKDVKPGDFIAVKATGSRQFYHIGAVYRDDNLNGLLDAGDLVLHAGPSPLHYSFLSEGGFDGQVVLLRPTSPI